MRNGLMCVLLLFFMAACGTAKIEPKTADRAGAAPKTLDQRDAGPRLTLLDIAETSKRYTSGVFGSVEVAARAPDPDDAGNLISQWGRVLAWMRSEDAVFRSCISYQIYCRTPELAAWRDLILSARRQGPMGRMNVVNRYFNQWPYLLDEEVYGRSDYWATPTEFMRRSGDCEDFAIAKFMALRHLGFRNDDMRIIVVTDKIRAIVHAVLAVYFGNEVLILDSLSDEILPHTAYNHYVAHYSVNETAQWEHIYLNGGPLAALDAGLTRGLTACVADAERLLG